MAMLSDAADAHGMSQAYAIALINFAWAAGQIFGAGGGGALAKAAGDARAVRTGGGLVCGHARVILVRREMNTRRSPARVYAPSARDRTRPCRGER